MTKKITDHVPSHPDVRFKAISDLALYENQDLLAMLVKTHNSTSLGATKQRLVQDLESVCRPWLFMSDDFAVTVRRCFIHRDTWVARYHRLNHITAGGCHSVEGLSKRHALKRLAQQISFHMQPNFLAEIADWAWPPKKGK